MNKVIAFAGSNSKTSINKQLVTYASKLLHDVSINILDLNDYELPLFGVDKERELGGYPDNAHKFLEQIKSSDGIIVSLAEHNGAYTVAFKNLLDWMSRIEGKTFYGKPMLLMATSTGKRGGKTVLGIAQDRFPRHNASIVDVFSLPSFNEHFSDGRITDNELDLELIAKVENFKKALLLKTETKY